MAAWVILYFERFYRATNVQSAHIGGMGIGLSVVREVMALHEGEVTVESVEGEGTTFTMRIPLTPAITGASAEDETEKTVEAHPVAKRAGVLTWRSGGHARLGRANDDRMAMRACETVRS